MYKRHGDTKQPKLTIYGCQFYGERWIIKETSMPQFYGSYIHPLTYIGGGGVLLNLFSDSEHGYKAKKMRYKRCILINICMIYVLV